MPAYHVIRGACQKDVGRFDVKVDHLHTTSLKFGAAAELSALPVTSWLDWADTMQTLLPQLMSAASHPLVMQVRQPLRNIQQDVPPKAIPA